MVNLVENLTRKECKLVNESFYNVIIQNDEEKMKTFIYPGSPVLSCEIAMMHKGRESCLHWLSSRHKPNIVIAQLLIDFGINIDHQDKNGDTALHFNVDKYLTHDKQNHMNMIKVLLKNGANRDIRNKKGLTPIQVALFAGDLDVAEEFLQEEDKLPNRTKLDKNHRCQHLAKCLLREGNHCNVLSTNYSVILHFLMLQNDEETFEFVAKNSKFDVKAIHEGCNLLYLLIYEGTLRMFAALVNVGVDLDAEFPYSVNTPLIAAIKNTRVDIVRFLLDSGVSVYKKGTFLFEGEPPPLLYAICTQNFEIIENLLKMGADVNAITNGCSILLLACCLRTRIDESPNPSFLLPFEKFFRFRMPTKLVGIHKKELSVKIVELLLDYGVDIETKNESNRNVLDQVCKCGKFNMVELLLSRGAKINQGVVPTLYYAIRGENPEIVRLVLEKGADVNSRCATSKLLREIGHIYRYDIFIETPLEWAIFLIKKDYICKKVIEVLMEYGVNLNTMEAVWRATPLHSVCQSREIISINYIKPNIESKEATIKLLLLNNANVNTLNRNGYVPLHYAIRNYKFTSERQRLPNIPTDFKPDLVALIAFIAMKIENKESVIKENLVLLEHEYAHPVFEECKNELSLMKRKICESNNFSFFNVLSKHIQTVGSALQKKGLLEVLNTGEYKKNFPIYADYLERRIRNATIFQRLVNLAIFLFQKHISKIILGEVTLAIFKFLDLHDVKNFTKACFVNVE